MHQSYNLPTAASHAPPYYYPAPIYNTASPASSDDLDFFQQLLYTAHDAAISQEERSEQSTQSDPSMAPDAEFVQSLQSIRATGPSPDHRWLNGGNQPEEVVAETIVRARKSWKTVKGRSEPVWPPELERALVQALLQYRPNDAQFSRALGRFPKRNRFISDYIFAVTGVRRTPKQVGSRLQQLKDVSCGKMLLSHVASWAQEPSSAESVHNDFPSDRKPDQDVFFLEAQSNSTTSGSYHDAFYAQPSLHAQANLHQGLASTSMSKFSTEMLQPYPVYAQTQHQPSTWFTSNQRLSGPFH